MTPKGTTAPAFAMRTLRSWFVCGDEVEEPRCRLICFAHGGAGASTFRKWRSFLPSEVQLCAVQLPGREARIQEPPRADFVALIQDLTEAVHRLPEKPFCLVGHSLGALLAFELARRLAEMAYRPPSVLCVSGHAAPSLARSLPRICGLADSEFLAAVQGYEGVPEGALEHPELARLLLPALRADFTLVEQYVYIPRLPLQCPILALAGLNDKTVSVDQVAEWHRETDGPFEMRTFPGSHFFPYQQAANVVNAIVCAVQSTNPGLWSGPRNSEPLAT